MDADLIFLFVPLLCALLWLSEFSFRIPPPEPVRRVIYQEDGTPLCYVEEAL